MSSWNWDTDIIVAGDFNLPGLFTRNFCGNTPVQHEYEKLFNQLNLNLMVHEPTRGGNLIDFILTNDDLLVTNVVVREGFSTSDHNKITYHLNISNDIDLKYSDLNYNFRMGNYTQMSNFLDTIDWDGLFMNINDVNEMWEVFANILDYAINLFVPKYKKRKKINNKWSFNTRKAYSNKVKLWRKYKKDKNVINRQNYIKASNNAKNLAIHDKYIEESKILKSGNIKVFYSFVNNKLTSRKSIPPIRKDGQIYEDAVDKANLFQSQFSSVFVEDDGLLPHFPFKTNNILQNVKITESIVLANLMKIPDKVSSGVDGFPSLLFKKLRFTLVKPLTTIFKLSFETSMLPYQWLDAKIIPIYKKGENSEVSNYRPISLTAVASKVLERIIKDEIMDYLLKNELISVKQHGFLSKRSTLTNVIKTLNNWFRAINDKKKYTRCILILQKLLIQYHIQSCYLNYLNMEFLGSF